MPVISEQKARWYERERWPFPKDRETADQYAEWIKQIPWKLFCTFTFAWKVSDRQADRIFTEFINRLERLLKCPVGYVRGDEKRMSGCGEPACGRHYHVLLACPNPTMKYIVKDLWMSMAGNRDDGCGADVKLYNPALNGASYVMKMINQPDGDWKPSNNLGLFLPSSGEVIDIRGRRRSRRHEARTEFFYQVAERLKIHMSKEKEYESKENIWVAKL